MPIPSFPNEVIDQILSYECLDRDDHYCFALVSRSWLGPAQKSLYNSIRIRLVEVYGGPDQGPESVDTRFDRDTWQLFSTLVSSPTLAASVRAVRFEVSHILDYPTSGLKGVSDVSTTPRACALSVIRLASAATSLSFDDEAWGLLSSIADFPPRLDRLRHLSIHRAHEEHCLKVLRRLPRLRSLSLHEMLDNPSGEPRERSNRLDSELEHLAITRCSGLQFKRIIWGAKGSIRSLKVPLDVVPSFDCKDFPLLTRLVMFPPCTVGWEPLGVAASLAGSRSIVSLELPTPLLDRISEIRHSALFPHPSMPCQQINVHLAPSLAGLFDLLNRMRYRTTPCKLGIP